MTTEIISGLPEDQHDYGMAKGHSPVADKVVCVDFDGVIRPWGPLMEDTPPFEGASETLQLLNEAGYKIVIFTSRLSETWLISAFGFKNTKEKYLEQLEYLSSYLDKYNIPRWDITCEKIPAIAYIDDRAIEFRDNWSDLGLRVLKCD